MSSKIFLSTESIVSHSLGILASEVDNETILLSTENSKYYGMVSTASRIWELTKSPIPITQIINILLREYDIERERCETEVFEFLGELLSDKLIIVE